MSTDASIASLVDLTALSAEQASTLLAAAGGDLDLAVALHFDDTTLPFLPAAEPPPPAVEELSDGFGLFSLLDGVDDDGPDAPASAPAAAAAARPPRRRRGNKGGAGGAPHDGRRKLERSVPDRSGSSARFDRPSWSDRFTQS